MKKIFSTIFVVMCLLVPAGNAFAKVNGAGSSASAGSSDTGTKDAPAPTSTTPTAQPTAGQCDFSAVPQCFKASEKNEYAIVILEESLDTVDGVDAYTSKEGSKIRSCQRMIRTANCAAEGEKKQSRTDIVKSGTCEPSGSIGEDNRVICEELTAIMTPLATGGAGVLTVYLSLIYRWAAGIVGIIAVFIIILNSILIIASQGEQGPIDEAKKRIIQSLGGIAVLFLSSVILYVINPDFFTL